MIRPILEHHDRAQFEVFVYSNVALPDEQTKLVQASADHWREILKLTDDDAAELVRQDGIDILIDLSLHMGGNRLLVFARKPAPVQATWLAYPSTSGMRAIDYAISDPYIDPPGTSEWFYSEQLVRLPHSFWCYPPPEDREFPLTPLPAQQRGYVTFGSLNAFFKINERVARLWARILAGVPAARLVVLTHRPDRPDSHARQMLARCGIDPQRVDVVERCDRAAYMRRLGEIDISLDPFPYNSHTTGMDSLWMGVPLVTMPGNLAIARAGACLLANVDLEELIAAGEDDYLRIACALASDLPRLAQLRSELRPRLRRSPLCDLPGFTRDLESLFRRMWASRCSAGAG
jgi:predicted O-linked N-acetylglucosamine transferase (SPINDLY family)